jgi:outer membrane lipoprotein-sorting protein
MFDTPSLTFDVRSLTYRPAAFGGSPSRRSFFALAAATLALALGAPHPALAEDAKALLAAADQIRNPEGSFSMTLSLAEYRSGKLNATSALTVFAKPAPNSGQYNNLVRFDQPARDAGKLLLRNGLDLWFYDPASRASVRISPQARLLGQASNGDVMSTNLAKDYSATLSGEETINDDTKTPRLCLKLKLKAERPDVAYAAVDYWIDQGTRRPVKAQYYTSEGRLLKTAFFRRYQFLLGRERPTESVIIDGLDPQWITVMRSTDLQSREIPQNWFQRDYLPRFTADES